MRISAMGLELIREMEGLRLEPYRVGSGRLTAGYGHELADEEKRISWPIDKQKAERWLQDDVMIAEKCLEETIEAPLQQHEWDALVSFVYNVGGGRKEKPSGFRKSTIRKRINALDNEGAAKEFERWIYDNHEVSPGLIVRRRIERMMFEGIFCGMTIVAFVRTIREIKEGR